jgi:hypothetical protein
MKEAEILRAICDYLAIKHYFFWHQNTAPAFDWKTNQFRPMQAFAPGLDGHGVLAVGEYDARQGHSALVLHGIADDGKSLLPALRIARDIVGTLVVALVDLLLRHEGVDVDRMRAMDLDGFQLLGLDLDVLAPGDLVAPPLFVLTNRFAGFLIHHRLAQPIAGLAIDLMKMRLAGLAGCGATTGHVTSESFR